MSKVSVILPVYNAAETIGRCIQSIINQTFSDWELICCDDNSKDQSLSILKQWAQKDKRIKILYNEENRRAAYTRNKCIKIAKGEYIALIDDDDYCAVDRLEKQVNFLNIHPEYSFVGSTGFFFDEGGVWKIPSLIEKPNPRDFLWNSCFINPSVMFRKCDVEKADLYRISKETRRAEDYDLFMRLYSLGYRGYNIQEPLVYYYRGQNSFAKCKYTYRIDEAKVRYYNFKNLKLFPVGLLFVFKPLIIGLIPISLIEKIKVVIK